MYFVVVYSLNQLKKDTDLGYLQQSHASTSGGSEVVAVQVATLRISVGLCAVLREHNIDWASGWGKPFSDKYFFW
jgi:hypothetical protein